MPCPESPDLICEPGHYVAPAYPGMTVLIKPSLPPPPLQVPFPIPQGAQTAKIFCSHGGEGKSLDNIQAWESDQIRAQYPIQGPCNDIDKHVPAEFRIEVTTTNGTRCSGTIVVVDAAGDGYPTPPMHLIAMVGG